MKILVMTAMYPTPTNPAFGSFVKTQVEALRDAGVDIELLIMAGRFRKLIYPRSVFQLRRRLRRGDIDLVHAHFSYVGLMARMQRRVPLVATFHGSDLLGDVKDATGRHTYYSPYTMAMGRWLGRSVDAAIVQSDEMAGKLGHREHVHIIPHEIDFDTFRVVPRDEARQMLGLKRDKPYLLFAAHRDNHVKRYPLARDAVEALKRELPDAELIVLHKETQDQLALYMNACDALVFTSFQEGSPNIVKQAMACNLPIVSTAVGDVREVIGDTAGCYVCPPRAEDFADRLRTILTQRQRTSGRDDVQRFDRPLVTRQIIDLYEQTIADFAAGRVAGKNMPETA